MNVLARTLIPVLTAVLVLLGPQGAPSAAAASSGTMVVRAYFFMASASNGDPSLVPVLRTVLRSPRTATAAMRELLAGPSAAERAASPRVSTAIPSGTGLLGVTITASVATVNLSRTFESGGGSFSVLGRLAQVVYTVTQFSSVTSVRFQLNGVPVTAFSGEGIVIDRPLARAAFRDDFLPPIFVDRPAYGAAAGNPTRVTGLANVFEARFRIAILDRWGRTLVERTVMATCGTGCWGRFDVTVGYRASFAQWGTLRVWNLSAKDGRPEQVRTYPVWLVPGG